MIENRIKCKAYHLILMFIIVIFFMRMESFGAEQTRPYLFDKSHSISEQDKQSIQASGSVGFSKGEELVVIYSEESSLPTEAEMVREIKSLLNQYDYGKKEGSRILANFLFVNKDGSGNYTTYYTSRFAVDMGQSMFVNTEINSRIQREINRNKDLVSLYLYTPELDVSYLYPVVTDIDKTILDDRKVKNASFELTEWEVQKNEAVYILWKEDLKEELVEEYLEKLYPSIPFLQEKTGVFVLCNQATGTVRVKLYGELTGKHSAAEIQKLENALTGFLEKYEVEQLVYTVEHFLDPNAPIPLSVRDFREQPKMPKTEIKWEAEFDEDGKLKGAKEMSEFLLFVLKVSVALAALFVIFIAIVIGAERHRQRKQQIQRMYEQGLFEERQRQENNKN